MKKINIKLIVGLSNPGEKYIDTRHNVGAWFIDTLCQQYGVTLKEDKKFFGLTTLMRYQNKDVRLLVPETFMNVSGKSVYALTHFFNISLNEILVVHDDLDLEAGTVRLKFGGGHGGHNGLRNIFQQFGQQKDFYRLRIGIGHPGHKSQVASYVLKKPSLDEKIAIDNAIEEAIRCTDILFIEGMEKAMNRLHTYQG